jgi:signal transduction histidine kinase/ligand-binding sensor domain-containing protein
MNHGNSISFSSRARPFLVFCRFSLLLCITFGWATALSQTFQFRNFTELSGLPSSETYHAIQDKTGFVWIATDNGVARFDGDEFVIYNRSKGLTDNTVFGMFEDGKGRIWFRTYSGALSYFDKGIITPYPHNNVLQPVLRNTILNKIVVKDEQLWFGTAGQGPAGYVDSIGNVTLLESKIGFDAPAYLYAYAVDSTEHLTGFTGTPKFLATILVEGRQYPVKIDPEFRHNPVAQCLRVGEWLYIAVNRDLFSYRDQHLEHVMTFEYPVINLSKDNSSSLWVGFFGGGVRKYTGRNFSTFTSIDGLAQSSVSSILQDSEGGYWFTTLDRGVFYFPNVSIHTEVYADAQKISAVARTHDALYTGNYAGEVARIEANLASRVIFSSTAPILALYEDRLGNFWWSSAQGYFKRSPGGTIVSKSSLRSIRGFFTNKKGEVCAYNSSSVYTFDGNGNPSSRLDLMRRPVHILVTDSVIYNGSLYGLERHDTNFLPLDMTPMFEGRISVIQAVAPRVILAGTIGNGLMVIDDNGQRMFNSQSGFNAENVYAITVTGATIWAGTEKGLFMSTLGSLRSSKPMWKRLTKSSGMLSDKCNFIGSVGNNILVFSDQGKSVIPVNVSTYVNEKPTAYIKSILVNNELQGPLIGELDHTRNNISINVGVISFNNRQLLHRNRLHRSAGWNYEAGSNVSYFDLNPGEYNIEVGASADNVNWYAVDHVVSLQIRVPWWRSWTFIALMGILIVISSWMIYLFRVNTIKRKHEYLELINSHQQRLIDSEIRTLERERKRIATDLHDGVGTALSSIKLLLSDSVKARDGERDTRVNEINENLTDVIAEIKRIVYDLRPPALERYGLQIGLKNLAERINNHGGISVKYDYYGQRELTPQLSITVYRIVQELINNTLKHAKATEIRIHVNQFDDEMNLMYEDNGIGMIGSSFNGLGLYSIESRVRSLTGRMSWESNHKGTFYNFDIPY